MSRAARRDTTWARFIVLTGLSGSGKSQAIRALEDLGYYSVDNLPVSLLPVMAELAQRQTEHNRVAVVMDIREPRFVSDFPRVYRKLKTNKHLASRLIFLEAGHAELVRRFSESRRPHPLAPDRPVTEGIREERASLRPKTGRDAAVAAYIRRQPIARTAIKKLSSLLRWMVPLYIQEGKSYLTIAIGCTGGRHRSVYIAEALKRELSDITGATVKVSHRDLVKKA